MGTHFRLSILHPKHCTVFFCILVCLQQGKVRKAGVTTPNLSTQIKCTSRSVLSVLIFHPPDTQHSNSVCLDESNIHTPLKEKNSLQNIRQRKKICFKIRSLQAATFAEGKNKKIMHLLIQIKIAPFPKM